MEDGGGGWIFFYLGGRPDSRQEGGNRNGNLKVKKAKDKEM